MLSDRPCLTVYCLVLAAKQSRDVFVYQPISLIRREIIFFAIFLQFFCDVGVWIMEVLL